MPNKKCRVEIYGCVSRLRLDEARVAVPLGTYEMRELSLDRYRLSGDGLPTLDLTLKEVAIYMHGEMKVVEGQWT
jgi:hypothetical protein